MHLGGFATSRSPLAADAARGAMHNINVSESDPACKLLSCQLLTLSLSLLCTIAIVSSAIRDFETFYYSPLRGNMGSYVLEYGCMGSLSSTRSPYKVVRPSVNYGEPKTLRQT